MQTEVALCPQMNEVVETSVQTVTLALGSQSPSIIRTESRLLVRFVISYNSITGVIVSLLPRASMFEHDLRHRLQDRIHSHPHLIATQHRRNSPLVQTIRRL